jgi:hypothetical protein
MVLELAAGWSSELEESRTLRRLGWAMPRRTELSKLTAVQRLYVPLADGCSGGRGNTRERGV